MAYNEQETRSFLIDPVLRVKGYDDHPWLRLETPAPVEPTGPKGRGVRAAAAPTTCCASGPETCPGPCRSGRSRPRRRTKTR